MADPLADKLRKLAAQQEQSRKAEKDILAIQERARAFVSDHADGEYQRLLTLLQKRVEEVNPALGDLPRFEFQGNQRMVKQGTVGAYFTFDKPFTNSPENQLRLSFASSVDAIYFAFDEPQPEPNRYALHAEASLGLDRIVWSGDLGILTSEQLADFILEQLTAYYLEHKR